MDEKLKQILIEAVKAGDEYQASELLWQLVIDCQNCPFKTVSGLPFSYTIKRGRNGELTKELWIDRRENSKSLAWSSIRLAFSNAMIIKSADRPKHLAIFAVFLISTLCCGALVCLRYRKQQNSI